MIKFHFYLLNHKTFKTLRVNYRLAKTSKRYFSASQTEFYGNPEVQKFIKVDTRYAEYTLKFEGLFVGYISNMWYEQGYFI